MIIIIFYVINLESVDNTFSRFRRDTLFTLQIVYCKRKFLESVRSLPRINQKVFFYHGREWGVL